MNNNSDDNLDNLDNGAERDKDNEVRIRKNQRQKKKDDRDSKEATFNAAIAAYKSGEFPSVNACAIAFGVSQTTLSRHIKSGDKFVGKGRKSIVFSQDEEAQIADFVKARVELGVGLSFHQLCLVIQELLARLKSVNPERYCPPSWENCYPEETFVRRLAERNGISLRRTMALSAARAVLTVSDLDSWFSNIKERFVDPPKFSEIWKDPQRIFNQDETALEFGSEHQSVLAPRGHKGPLYNIGGNSREHVTLSVTVSASGEVAGMRVVYSGKRWSNG